MVTNTARAIQILNEALAAEPGAMCKLFQRVPTTGGLDDHPTIQVSPNDDHAISVLGLINGMFGIDVRTGYGFITAVWEGDELVRFEHTDFAAIPASRA